MVTTLVHDSAPAMSRRSLDQALGWVRHQEHR